MNSVPFGIVRIGKHVFATGLTWVPLTRPRDLTGDAKAQMKKFGGDAYVIRQGAGSAQAGIASTSDGCANGMLTLAGAVADHIAATEYVVSGHRQRLSDWIGIFAIGSDQWFLMAVRDGAIVPNCDRIGTLDDAIELLEQTYGIGGWSAVVGSPDLPMRASYHNYLPLSIDDALGMKGGKLAKARRYAIHAKQNPKTLLIAGAAGLLALSAIAAGVWMYRDYQAQKEAEELAALQAELALLQQPQSQPVPRRIVEAPRSWVVVPTPASLVSECMEHLDIPAAPGSWNFGGYTCEATGSTVALVRDGSNIAHLRALLPEAQLEQDQDNAKWHRPFAELKSRDDDLQAWGPLETALISRMQTLNVTVSVGAPVQPAPPPIAPEEAEMVEIRAADWMERSLAIGPTPIMPERLLGAIDAPGLRLTKISYTDGQWTYEGTFYAK